MILRTTTLCFSGHRYYAGEPTGEARLAAALEAAFGDGYRTFISGMAPGFDLAAAEAVVRLRGGDSGDGELLRPVRLVAAIPFVRQAAKYPAEDRARYEALLDLADEVAVLSERYSYGCYYRRDDWMVERSARIVCWYDSSGGSGRGSGRSVGSRGSGYSGNSSGGTRYTVRRAVAQGLEVVNLFRNPDTLF